MYGVDPAAGDAERTAFRRSEKRYKLYKSLDPNSRNKKPVVNPVDLSEVVDFRQVLESFQVTGDTPPGIVRFECQELDQPIFCFKDRPGFYFIPRALSFEEQCHWIRQSLLSFPQPPNRTNLTALYGPVTDLLIAVQEKKVLVEDNVAAHLGHESTAKENNIQSSRYVFSEASINSRPKGLSKSVAASVLLRKLRWSTLGLQFDWSKRNYDLSLPHNNIPDALCTLAKKMAVPAMASGEEFHPEAAIVNYFGPRVPRIFTDNMHSEVSAFMSHFSGEDDRVFSDYLKSSRININIRQVN